MSDPATQVFMSASARRQGEWWGVQADEWAAIQEPTAKALWRAALDMGCVARDVTVLDAGCGAGGALLEVRSRGAIGSGFDASQKLLAIARRRLPDSHLTLGDVESIPFPDSAFEVVVALNVLPFTANPAGAARELTRVCAPGGRIVASVWGPPEHCEMAAVRVAILTLSPGENHRRGIFELSGPGELETLFIGIPGLALRGTHDVDVYFEYPDLDTAVRGQLSDGSTQPSMEAYGAERVAGALWWALHAFEQPSRAVRIENLFQCLIADRLPV